MPRLVLALGLAALVAGCTATPRLAATGPYAQTDGLARRALADPDPFSLVDASGDPISEEDADVFISRPIQIPRGAKVAVLFTDARTRFEVGAGDVAARGAFAEALRETVGPGAARTVSVLPSILTPSRPDIPALRETGVRLQADGFLVVRVSTGLLRNNRVFRDDQFRSYATVEAVLLDVRTGALPFTAVATRQRTGTKTDADLTGDDARLRVEREAAVEALREVGGRLAVFLGEEGRAP